jgi:hypothetical protein
MALNQILLRFTEKKTQVYTRWKVKWCNLYLFSYETIIKSSFFKSTSEKFIYRKELWDIFLILVIYFNININSERN